MFKVYKTIGLSLAFMLSVATTGALLLSSMHKAVASEGQSRSAGESVSPILLSTTESLEGFKIKEYRGIVRGVTVRQPTAGQSFKASLKSIVGGKMSPFISMCETGRQQAEDIMIERAQAKGANAIVGFRYDSSAFGDSDDMGTEVVCYGTAVIIVPNTTLKSANLP